MATANPADSNKPVARATVATPSTEKAAPAVTVAPPTRREFLYYIWGASIALLLGQATAGLIWFTYPRFREGEFGGIFPFNPEDLPERGAPPASVPAGRFHVSHTPNGVLALYGVCTHLGCLPRWVATNNRFECPCHGSKFNGDGSYIEGPAPRGLDRFRLTIVYADGSTAESDDTGGPVPLEPGRQVMQILVNTGSRILGPAI